MKVDVSRDVQIQEDDAWHWSKAPEAETQEGVFPISKISPANIDAPEDDEVNEDEPRNPRI